MTMRDFEKDRRTIQDRKDGYVTNEVFLKYADEGWPAALDRIAELERQLQVAAEHMVSEIVCPKEVSEEECRKREGDCKTCWLEYWRQKATTSKTETVGEGAE